MCWIKELRERCTVHSLSRCRSDNFNPSNPQISRLLNPEGLDAKLGKRHRVEFEKIDHLLGLLTLLFGKESTEAALHLLLCYDQVSQDCCLTGCIGKHIGLIEYPLP